MKGKLGKRKRENAFNAILLESIDEAFLTLGKKACSAIYMHLEVEFAIPRQDIPCRVNDFSDALEQIFGLAAQPLEILIMKFLNEKVNCTYNWVGPSWLVPDLSFTKYVKLMELWCEDTCRIGEVEVILDDGERQEQKTR
jgi:hypothetical protein